VLAGCSDSGGDTPADPNAPMLQVARGGYCRQDTVVGNVDFVFTVRNDGFSSASNTGVELRMYDHTGELTEHPTQEPILSFPGGASKRIAASSDFDAGKTLAKCVVVAAGRARSLRVGSRPPRHPVKPLDEELRSADKELAAQKHEAADFAAAAKLSVLPFTQLAGKRSVQVAFVLRRRGVDAHHQVQACAGSYLKQGYDGVYCFAFRSELAYRASRPRLTGSGGFQHTCYLARWTHTLDGTDESAGDPGDPTCP